MYLSRSFCYFFLFILENIKNRVYISKIEMIHGCVWVNIKIIVGDISHNLFLQ